MSFQSSIVLLHPGRSPQLRLHELRSICDNLRATLFLENDFFSAAIRFDTNGEEVSHIAWDEDGTIGSVDRDLEDEMDWQHEKQSWTWQQIWPDESLNDQIVSRANINLGNLSDSTIKELNRSDQGRTSPCGISITEMSISIGPAWVGELAGELPEDECYGCMEVSLSGYGYFTWQPLAAYWKSIKQSETLHKVLNICKKIQPVSPKTNVNQLKERLRNLFLNYEEYQLGDWIVSVEESG